MTPQDQPAPPHSDYAARSHATRQRILSSAVKVLAEFGYAGASTVRIQQHAQVSRGRLLHQYAQRDELLLAAVQHLAEARITTIDALLDCPADPRERVRTAITVMWSTYRQDYFWAATELWLAARHNHALAVALREREPALGAAVRAKIDDLFGGDLVAHPRYTSLRELLNSSMRGVALTYAFEPREHADDSHLGLWIDLALRELDLA